MIKIVPLSIMIWLRCFNLTHLLVEWLVLWWRIQ